MARAALHPWEEPPISGSRGSGTVFFVGCAMGCVYCQNAELSHASRDGRPGRSIDVERLASIFLELQAQGAHNVNLVTPTHFAPSIIDAVARAKADGLTVPIVYNTSGYERSEIVSALGGTVDVWLTDYKYGDAVLAHAHAQAADYTNVASKALAKMYDNLMDSGGRRLDDGGIMEQGVIVRHLLLPGGVENAKLVLDTIYRICGTDDVDVSIMNQYTPTEAARAFGAPLDRAVTEKEYEDVLTYADDLGFQQLWWQEGGTVSESFIPEWDDTGV